MMLLCIKCLKATKPICAVDNVFLRNIKNRININAGGFIMAINNTLMMVQLGFPTGVVGGL